ASHHPESAPTCTDECTQVHNQVHLGAQQEDTKKKIQEENKVVVSNPERPEDIHQELWDYSLKMAEHDPEAYARACMKRKWKPSKKKLDPDSEESRHRYTSGEYADFWED
ncbi:unnamed protein product, partial [marine sediment metagenome]